MKPYEYMTLFALIAGPFLAVGIQLWFTKRQEDRRRKLWVLDTLMQYRGRVLYSDSVRALNNIDLVYYDSPSVGAKFIALLDLLESQEMTTVPLSPWTTTKVDDRLTELLSEMCKVLGYDLDHTRIKTKAYRPFAHVIEEQSNADIRNALLPLLKGTSPLHIKSDDMPMGN
jgi:uncharacterized protein DUF6680